MSGKWCSNLSWWEKLHFWVNWCAVWRFWPLWACRHRQQRSPCWSAFASTLSRSSTGFAPSINNSEANECPDLQSPAPPSSSLIILTNHVNCSDHSRIEGSGLFCRKLFGVMICTCMCLSTFYCRFVNKDVSLFIQTYWCRCHAFSPCDC